MLFRKRPDARDKGIQTEILEFSISEGILPQISNLGGNDYSIDDEVKNLKANTKKKTIKVHNLLGRIKEREGDERKRPVHPQTNFYKYKERGNI